MPRAPTEPPHASGPAVAARIALLTISDTRTASDDVSGATARESIEAAGHRIVDYRIERDEPDAVRGAVETWLAGDACDAIVTNGGTGISRRDRTCEALATLLEQRLDGFGELFRMLSYEQVGAAAMLSRAVGGVAQGKLLFVLPGSPAAVDLALTKLILPQLSHLLGELRR